MEEVLPQLRRSQRAPPTWWGSCGDERPLRRFVAILVIYAMGVAITIMCSGHPCSSLVKEGGGVLGGRLLSDIMNPQGRRTGELRGHYEAYDSLCTGGDVGRVIQLNPVTYSPWLLQACRNITSGGEGGGSFAGDKKYGYARLELLFTYNGDQAKASGKGSRMYLAWEGKDLRDMVKLAADCGTSTSQRIGGGCTRAVSEGPKFESVSARRDCALQATLRELLFFCIRNKANTPPTVCIDPRGTMEVWLNAVESSLFITAIQHYFTLR
jgi:hypothetical protein